MKIKTTICSKHDDIYDLCTELQKLDFRKSIKATVISISKKIQKIVNNAKEDGQKMEDRLSEYHDVICGLGFKRKKK